MPWGLSEEKALQLRSRLTRVRGLFNADEASVELLELLNRVAKDCGGTPYRSGDPAPATSRIITLRFRSETGSPRGMKRSYLFANQRAAIGAFRVIEMTLGESLLAGQIVNPKRLA